MERTLMELSARLATSARLPARLIATPEGCLPPLIVAINAGGFDLRSTTKMSLPGTPFHAPPSCTQSIELATRARLSSGVMARFTGGPNTEFISGRAVTSRGFSRLLMSRMATASLPGGENSSLPSASQNTLLSIPTIICSAKVELTNAPRYNASGILQSHVLFRVNLFMGPPQGLQPIVRSEVVEFLVGAVLALSVGLSATFVGLDRDRAF